MLKLKVFTALTCAALLVTACTSAPQPPAAPAASDVAVKSTTRVMDAGGRAALTAFTSLGASPVQRYELRYRVTPQTATLSAGQVLVSEPGPNAPYGYLVKVRSAREEQGVVVVEADQAKLEDALNKGQADFQVDLKPEQLTSARPLAPGVSMLPSSPRIGAASLIDSNTVLPWEISLDKVLYDGDDKPETTNDQVGTTGKVKFALGLDLHLNIGGEEGNAVRAKVSLDQSTDLKLFAHGNYKFKESKPLYEYFFTPISFPVGPLPVVLVPKLIISLDSSGQIKGDMTFDIAQTFHAAAGTEYKKGQWHDLSSGPDFKLVPGAFEGQMNANLQVGPSVRAEFLLYGLAGAYADLGVYADLNLQYPSVPLWQADLCAAANAGVSVDLIFTAFQYGGNIFTKCANLAMAQNNPPVVTDLTAERQPVFGEGTPTGPLNTADVVDVCALATDPDAADRTLKYVFTSDRDTLNETVSPDGCITHRFQQEGLRHITVTTVDHEGLKATRTMPLQIVQFQAPAPTVSIQSPTGNQTFTLQGSALTAPLLGLSSLNDCAKETWSSSDPTDVISTAHNCGAPSITFTTTGPRTITLTAVGENHAAGVAQVSVNVVGKTNDNVPAQALLAIQHHPERPVNLKFGESVTAQMLLSDADLDPVDYVLKVFRKGEPGTAVVVAQGTAAPGVLEHTFAPSAALPGSGAATDYVLQLEATDHHHPDLATSAVEVHMDAIVK